MVLKGVDMSGYDLAAAEARHLAFDETLDRIRAEGAQAYGDGLGRADNPYVDHPEVHYARAWTGGWAEACLGIWTPPRPLEEREKEAEEFLARVPR